MIYGPNQICLQGSAPQQKALFDFAANSDQLPEAAAQFYSALIANKPAQPEATSKTEQAYHKI